MEAEKRKKQLAKYQENTFRTTAILRLKSIEEAIKFVNERGYIHFWPIKGFRFPSLWAAVAGDRPVPNDHDDPGHLTWRWKDDLIGKKHLYYGRQLGKKNSFISLEALPNFYTLSPNYGEYETDYLIQYQQGKLTAEAKAVYEALLFEGPLDTLSLRKRSRMASTSSSSRFQRALNALQAELKVLPVGISQAGAWRYAFIYDILPRHFPNLENKAQLISEMNASAYILVSFIRSLGWVDTKQVRKMFRWDQSRIEKTVKHILSNELLPLVKVGGKDDAVFILQEILDI